MASLNRTVAPADLPVTVDAVKAALRIDGADEDDLIAALIAAATDEAETRLSRALLPQTWVMTLDRLIEPIRLPWAVARTVTVDYQATAGVWTPVDAGAVTLIQGPPSAVIPAYGACWPCPIAHVDAVRVTFSAASWGTPAAIPAGIKQWITAKVGAMFAQREASGPLPSYEYRFLDGLLHPWIVPDYAYRSAHDHRR